MSFFLPVTLYSQFNLFTLTNHGKTDTEQAISNKVWNKGKNNNNSVFSFKKIKKRKKKAQRRLRFFRGSNV